jgi:UDPglucose--hexose-1-phosphate uridylyltransferase
MYHENLLSGLITYAIEKQLIETDEISTRLGFLCDFFQYEHIEYNDQIHRPYHELMTECLDLLYNRGLMVWNTLEERDLFEAKIMDLVMPSPKVVKETFKSLYQHSPWDATDYLYKLSKDVNYIKTRRLKENIDWMHDSPYGKLQMTINLAKPEKDPRDIANALKAEQVESVDRPKCVICKENEQNEWNARKNLRIVPITLGGELWHFQYSPYLYYNEHAIILHDEHKPMHISHQTFDFLFDFVNAFPTYFIGSNADLPIVGGSILSHDHFQAGRHHFPIQDAKPIRSFHHVKNLTIEHLNWPMSTIRLKSKDQQLVKDYACHLFDLWKHYTNLKLQIIANTKEIRHNTVTPIARLTAEGYELDLILRNNRTTEEYPDGIFHPHPDVHHIKKENIGLIEAMGLAILPGRLKSELDLIEKVIQHGNPIDPSLDKHLVWMETLKKLPKLDSKVLYEAVGKKFERVLADSGVFKLDFEGIRAMHQIIMELD